MNAWVGSLKGAVDSLDFETDINRENAAALGYAGIDRFLVRVLWWHFGAAALLVLTNAVFKLSEHFASPIAWRVISPVEGMGALVLALAAAWVPTELRGKLRSHYAYRILMSVALTTFSYLFVFLSGGAIEMHFHFFIVMGLLVIYSDWRLGWLVLVLTAAHHTVLNYLEPAWVYSYGRNDLSIIAHGVPVLVMAIFTTRLCETQRAAVEALAKTSSALQQDNLARQRAEAALRQAHDRLETRVQERTAELSAANAALRVEVIEREQADENVRQAQRRFRALIEHSADAVSMLTPQGILTYVSPAEERVLGYPPADLLGSNLFELIHPDDMPGVSTTMGGLLESPGNTVTAEYRMRHQDGSWRWIEGTGTNLLEEPGVQAIVANYRDITERHEADEKLAAQHEEIRATTQQLWQAAKLATMGELVAGIAHELNNPLATISLRMESMLGQLPADDPLRRPLKVVQQEAERMAALVASLLQLGRRGQPQVSTLDVPDELSQALELMHYHLDQRKISLETDFEPDVPRVLADRQQLRQVFLNLLTNAADAMPDGGRLTVRVAGGGPAEPGLVTVEVIDAGAGIPPEILAQVWEPFFTTKSEGKGTGLGLSICRHILQEHGATIELISRLGEGTTARVRLPLRPPDRTGHSTRLQAESPSPVGPTAAAGPTTTVGPTPA